MPRPTLRDFHVDRALTNMSLAYSNEMYVANQVAPVVPVNYKSDVYFKFDESAFFRRRAKARAPGTRSQRADYSLSTASYICMSYALAKEIPDEVRRNADAPLRPDVTAVNFVTDGLMLDMEKRIADLTTGGSGLWAYSDTPSTQWSSDTSDPYGDINTLKSNIIQQIGRMPNVAVMSWDVWQNLENHPDLLDRVKYTRPGAVLDPSDVGRWFGFDRVLVGYSIYDVALEGQTASKLYLWGDGFWAGYVTSGPALEEPTAIYTFKWGDRVVRRFREDQERQDIIDAEEYTDEVITASIAGGVLYNVV